ncbi:anhydro-N-acetylmuramic acid kinase [Aplysia californica]|uniref:Anhydro-N-acetylmuramic acid kinase n=1 Tax=Aplysia californica TaxID=6500 RepID=A0ABM1ADX3_APLCA|nr:anhydro-N-acetylmuramic acid kinase [Aplysia californica]
MTSYYGIGLMSGSSMDGLDLCFAELMGDPESDVWGYRLEHAVTVGYSTELKERLTHAVNLSGIELITLQVDWSHFVGQCLEKFIESKRLRPDFAASHGHTIFHQADKGISFQLGDGEIISSYLRCPFVCNFVTKDMALGGQGAPLVSCGEKFLFLQTDLCLSLGGIANVGCKGDKGFDVCPCNTVLNHLAKLHDPDLTYDKGGQLAAQGKVIPELLEELENLDFYQQTGPKSLGYEWVLDNVLPLLKPERHPIPDLLRTFVEHISDHVTRGCVKNIAKPSGTVLVTGGGAFNTTLMRLISSKMAEHHITIVDTENEIVEYKEALVFAFLGLRCLLGVENVFASVTGARTDTIAGSIHHGTHSHEKPALQDKFNFLIHKRNAGVSELRIIREK